MTIPIKTLKTGFSMPVFGLGTWQMGGRETRNFQNDDRRDILAIQKAISLGLTHIDTAESYANGYSETLLGQAIAGYDRSKLFLTTKIHADHLKYNDVLKSCQASLKRMNTDYLDLYLIHSPSMQVPIQETLRAMDKLVQDGLVKNIGVSNFKTDRLKNAQQYTNNKIVINQVYYNLLMREPEHEGLLEYCQQNDIFLEAYRPLEKGMLLDNQSELITDLAKKYNKTPSQIAINWLISQKNVLTLFKTSSIEHLEENIGSLGWEMNQEDIEKLRKNFPNQIMVPENLPLK
ncbi:aldo/keto reductase [Patescibacteria group bacterium]|nr:aldo/keto reductase [Patescibacteria group bacterium]